MKKRIVQSAEGARLAAIAAAAGIIGTISAFERKTQRAEYTDVGEAWEILCAVRKDARLALRELMRKPAAGAVPELVRAMLAYIEWGESVPYGAPSPLLKRAENAVKRVKGDAAARDPVLEALDNVTAALETCMAHFAPRMPAADRVSREARIQEARDILKGAQ